MRLGDQFDASVANQLQSLEHKLSNRKALAWDMADVKAAEVSAIIKQQLTGFDSGYLWTKSEAYFKSVTGLPVLWLVNAQYETGLL